MAEFKFGIKSESRLDQVHPTLVLVMRESLAYGIMDFAITEGHRDEETQNKYYYAKPSKSKVKFPDGKHNKIPALAVDVVPYIKGDASWHNLHCCILAGVILSAAAKLGIEVRWGGNWNMDSEPITDQEFQDLVHFELVGY